MTREQALRIAGVAVTVLLVPGGSLIAAGLLVRHWRERRTASTADTRLTD
jgi:hypothetical protein